MTAQCEVCFRRCRPEEGRTGFCGARENRGGMIIPKTYGQLTAIALDPIEKKPLRRFRPGSMILSAGRVVLPFLRSCIVRVPGRFPAGARFLFSVSASCPSGRK